MDNRGHAKASAPEAAGRAHADRSAVHPRLYFGPHDLAGLGRIGYAAPGYLSEQSFTVAYFGDKQVTFALPPRQPESIENPPEFDPKFGHYPYWTAMSRQIQVRLESLALSYVMTGDQRYARRAIEYMLALGEWQTWTDLEYGPRTCLDTCHLAMGTAFAYDACWDAMSGQERARIREALSRLALAPLAQDASERTEHNLQMLRNAALGLGALALLPEQPQLFPHLQQARDFFRWWLDLREVSPNTEGLAYTSYGLDNCLLFGAALATSESDRSIIEHPYVAKAVRWALYFWGARSSGLVNFCDASVGHPFEVTMRVANKYLRNPYAGYYLQQTGLLARRDFGAVVLHNSHPAVAWPPPWAPSAAFRTIGWAALRSGWGDEDTLLAFLSSSSKEGHCHFDANHFMINRAGEWLATDSGYKSYKGGQLTDFGLGTAGHNSVLIGGAGQVNKAGAITDFFTSPGFDYLVGDASRCYDPQVLWRFLRRVMYIRPHLFLMLDELEAPEPKRFEFLLHTDESGQYAIDGKIARLGQVMSSSRVSLVKPAARLEVRFLEPPAMQITFGHRDGTEDEYPPFITARDSRPRESQRFLTAFLPELKPITELTLELEKYEAEPGDHTGQAPKPGSVVRLQSFGALLFRAAKPGDSLTLHLPVPTEAEYRIVGHFLKSPAYGDWQMRIDGREAGQAYRGYAPDVRTYQEHDLGTMHLTGGRHEFTFTVTGRSDLSSGYLVGLDDIELWPMEAPAAPPGLVTSRLRRLSGDGWIGASCVVAPPESEPASRAKAKRAAAKKPRTRARVSNETRYRAYFRLTGADEIADQDVRTDADAALIVERPGVDAEIAAYRATRIAIGGRDLIQASIPISFALVPGEQWSLTLESDTTGDAVFYLGAQPRRPSLPPSLARSVRYDPTAPALRIRLRPGSHTITWTMG
jgi:hypothetical protein